MERICDFGVALPSGVSSLCKRRAVPSVHLPLSCPHLSAACAKTRRRAVSLSPQAPNWAGGVLLLGAERMTEPAKISEKGREDLGGVESG